MSTSFNPLFLDSDGEVKRTPSGYVIPLEKGATGVDNTSVAANAVFAGPVSGSASSASIRALVPADLGSGSASSSTFLRGDQTWVTPAFGSSITSNTRKSVSTPNALGVFVPAPVPSTGIFTIGSTLSTGDSTWSNESPIAHPTGNWVYVPQASSGASTVGQVLQYTVGQNGDLTLTATVSCGFSMTKTKGSLQGSIDPTGSYLVTLSKSDLYLEAFSVNPTTGALTPLNTVSLADTGPGGPDYSTPAICLGKINGSIIAYVVSTVGGASNFCIAAYTVGASGLTYTGESSTQSMPAGATMNSYGVSLCLDSSGTMLWMGSTDFASYSKIYSYSIGSSSVVPVYQSTATQTDYTTSPAAMAVDPLGMYLFSFGGNIAAYSIGDLGSLTLGPVCSAGISVSYSTYTGMAVDSLGQYLYICTDTGGIQSLAISRATGALTAIPTSWTSSQALVIIALDPTNRWFWTLDSGGNTLSSFIIQPATQPGALAPTANPTFSGTITLPAVGVINSATTTSLQVAGTTRIQATSTGAAVTGTLSASSTLTASSGLTVSAGTVSLPSASVSTTALTGTLAAAQHPALTGAVTSTAGSLATVLGSAPSYYAPSTTGTNSYACTCSPGPSALVAGQTYSVLISITNTSTSCTLAINGLAATTVTRLGTAALAIGDLVTGTIAEMVYDGTYLQLQNPRATYLPLSPSLIQFSGSSTGTNSQPQVWLDSTGRININVASGNAIGFSANGVTSLSLPSSSTANLVLGGGGAGNVAASTSNYGVAIGYGSGAANTTGSYWTAVGNQAGYSITTGYSWTAVGYQAGYSNSNGYCWTAVGRQSGYSNVSGSYWTAIGHQAGYSSTTGHDWVAVGYYAGHSNTAGGYWTALGSQAGYFNTSGDYWTALGRQAGYSSTTGGNWTAVGYSAGYGVSGELATTLDQNWTAIGYAAGRNATVTPLTTECDNWMALGNGAQVTGSNQIQLGNSSITLCATSGTMQANLFQTMTAAITANGSSAPVPNVLGIGATGGPQTAAQFGWVKILLSDGSSAWVQAYK